MSVRTPIDALLDQVKMRCTRCNAPAGSCSCWTKCRCGWLFETGAACRNPRHVGEAVAGDVAATVLSRLEGRRVGKGLKDAIETAVYDAVLAWMDEFTQAQPNGK